jgi:SAM-dependent methyltransferase
MTDDPADRAAFERFVAALDAVVAAQRLERLLLAGPRGADAGDLQRLTVRPLVLRGAPCLSFVWSHERRDLTQNFEPAEGLARLHELIGTRFANAHLLTDDAEWQLARSRKGRYRVHHAAREAAAAAGGEPTHNRERLHPVPLGRPYLAALGVTDAAGRLVPAMARKWRQINKFVEIMQGALAASPLAGRRAVEVLDFGAGKGYLSFALHDHLCRTLGLEAQVTAVELRPELVAAGNRIARELGLRGMRFEQGDIVSLPARPVDVVIALHACDTLTDHAMHRAVRGGAAIVCCAPCCHKQLRPQLLQPHPLRPVLRHGVHLGQEAEMLTDSLRALLLEACGYDTQVFEFVSLEHTAKNKMILAIKRAAPVAPGPVLEQVQALEAFYGVHEQCLETLLRADGAWPPAGPGPAG